MSLRIEQLSYRYPNGKMSVIDQLNLEVTDGQRVVITGPTGCGKSTLLRLIVGSLQRHGQGDVSGTVFWNEQPITDLHPHERARAVARVAQQPKDQILAQRVDEELAFGMSAIGYSSSQQKAAIQPLLDQVQLLIAPERHPNTLSGGQLQRLMIASALATKSEILCLDEPLAHLDRNGTQKLLGVLTQLAEMGVIVIMVEHRLALCAQWADQVYTMSGGQLNTLPPSELPSQKSQAVIVSHLPVTRDEVIWSHEKMTWAYPKSPPVFESQQLSLFRGEWVALEGINGAGKSSLLRFLERNPDSRRLLVLPQDPALCLFSDTVIDELAYGPRSWGMDNIDEWLITVAEALEISDLLHRAPLSLSSGQQLRVALGAILACKPEIIGLDEPTVGQDHAHVVSILQAIEALAPQATVVISTHDERLLDGAMDRHIRIVDGQVSSVDAPRRQR